MKSDQDISLQWKKHLKIAKDGLSRQYRNTEDCQAFYAGDLMDFWVGAQTTDQFGIKKRSMVQISKVKPYVNAVKGFIAQNRRSIKYNARINGNKMQEAYSDYANGMAAYLRGKTYADQKETQQDGDMLINGYGAIETALTYTNGQSTVDPNGQIAMGRLDPLAVGWDPFARETNLLDARFVYYQQIYPLESALELFQHSTEEDFESAKDTDLLDGEGGYKFYARGGRYNKIRESAVEWSDQKNTMVKVYFYQWYDYESFYRCENPLFKNPHLAPLYMQQLDILAQQSQDDLFAFNPRAEILSFNADIKKSLEKLFGDTLEIFEQKRKVYYSAVLSKNHIFTKYRNISQQGFTIKFKTGDFDAKNKIWVGMVNPMKEPTLYYNKALTELMYIIGSNSKGGVLVEEDAVEDHQKFEQQWAKTDAVIVVASGAVANNKIRSKKEPFTTTGYENILSAMASDIVDVTGIDKSFLGSSENKQETGILYARRIRQVVSGLACYFDAITLFSLEHARLLQDLMYVYAENNDGSLFSIIGKDGKLQFMQIARDKLLAEYDVTITEAAQSPEDKQEFATVLTTIAEKLAQIDPQSAKLILAISVKYLPIDHADQQVIMQALVPQGQVDPAQFQQLQEQVQKLLSPFAQAELAEKQSKAKLNEAKAQLDAAKLAEVAASTTQKKADAFHKVHEAVLDEYVAKHDPNPQLQA